VPFILFIDSASLFNHFLFLKCNILTSCWCCIFYLCLHPINLIFFFRSSVQDYHKLFLSSVVLGTKELNIGYNNAMPCYFNRKGNLLSANENYECHYWLLFFSFQIRVSNAVAVPVYIILHLAPLHSLVNFNHQLLRVMHEWFTTHILV
jgi:hypothetical protein